MIPDWLSQSTLIHLCSSHHQHEWFSQGWRKCLNSPKTHLVKVLVTCDSELNVMTWKTLYWRSCWSVAQQYLQLKSMWTKMGNILWKIKTTYITFGHQMTYLKQIFLYPWSTKNFPQWSTSNFSLRHQMNTNCQVSRWWE